MSPFWEHIARVEEENRTEKFQSVPDGTFREIYTKANHRKPVFEPGWCRIWVVRVGSDIVAHASLYDLGQHEIVFGTINIERDWRAHGLFGKLQAKRFAFLDEHQLTLTGAVAVGNDRAWFAHRRAGLQYLRHDENGIWVYREPRPRDTLK